MRSSKTILLILSSLAMVGIASATTINPPSTLPYKEKQDKQERPEIPSVPPEPFELELPDNSKHRKVKALQQSPPLYNERWLEGACSRTVSLVFDVNRNGKPIRIYVTKSSGSASFDYAAEETVRGWRYEPIQSDEPERYRKNLQTTLTITAPNCENSEE